MKFTAIDIETTGLGPERDRIIEIGAVRFEDGVQKEIFSTLVQPQIGSLPERIVELTGITDEMLLGAPSEAVAMEQLLAFLAEDEVLLGHNIPFEYSFLKVAAGRLGKTFAFDGIDTLYLARLCRPELPKKNLSVMCEEYNIQTECAHRAYEDALAAAKLYFCLQEQFAEAHPEWFAARPLSYEQKKTEPVTPKQVRYLKAIIDTYHLTLAPDFATLTKSEASRLIDKLLSTYGRI